MADTKPEYGIDALPVIRRLAAIAFICFMAGALCFFLIDNYLRWITLCIALSYTIVFSLTAALMYRYAKKGKFRHRDRMLGMIQWKGDENVLDIGTGKGLLMIGAAKKLSTGKAYGVDIWNKADLSGNAIENTLKNISIEAVAGKAQVLQQDARALGFDNNYFDVVLSNLCLHNISNAEGRDKACAEIARVLKPGGTALISDFRNTRQYRKVFRQMGLGTTLSPPYMADTFPPLRILRVTKL